MKLKELTPEQAARLPGIRDEWIKIGLCTDPCDFEAAKKYACIAYEKAGLAPPEEFLLHKSPLETKQYLEELGIEHNLLNYGWGSMDAGWLSFYSAMGEFGIDVSILDGLFGIAKTCGWWSPWDKICILQDRPCEIHMVDGRCHREDGPAILYRDGFSVWIIEGVRVDEQIVMRPETQTIDQINQEQNEEIKRIRIQRYGWERYLADINAQVLDERENPIEGTYETLYKANDMAVLVCACPSTAKIFCLEVDPKTKTCKDAQSYLSSGMSDRIIAAS